MSRPKIPKRICDEPKVDTFRPAGKSGRSSDVINMSVEEYEVFRLIDREELTQEQCAVVMGVARSTVQRLYNIARKKLAESIVDGKVLKISGGDYSLCVKKKDQRMCSHCNRHQQRHDNSGKS